MITKNRICSHEAAHIVTAYKKGLKFNYATVLSERRDDGALAFVNFEGTPLTEYQGFLIACAANVWINNQLNRNDDLSQNEYEADYRIAKLCAKDLGKTVDELYPKAKKEILKIMEYNWQLVDFVTNRLYGNSRIEYRELEIFELTH